MNQCLRNLGELAASKEACLEAIKLNPASFEGHCELAITLHTLDEFSGARIAFEKAIEISPEYYKGYFFFSDS